MKVFNRLFSESMCPNCQVVVPQIRKINKKIDKKNEIKNINIKDEKNLGAVFFPITRVMRYEEDEENKEMMGTPTISLGKIKGNKIVEDINIKGKYPPELLEAFLSGYLSKEVDDEEREAYEQEIMEGFKK